MPEIRPLTSADRPAFRALRLQALTVSPDEFMMTAQEEQAVPRLHIESALDQASPGNVFLGAFEDGRLIAIGGLLAENLRKRRHIGHIASLFVHPDHRRHGIARELLERLLSLALGAGLRVVRLEVVDGNSAAIELYGSVGFSAYGREPAAYRLDGREWDLLLMTRSIP